MNLVFTTQFSEEIENVIQFIENINTAGSGWRWFEKLEAFLVEQLAFPETHSRCKNAAFHKYQLRCLFYHDWTIAYTYDETSILLVAFLHNSNIID